MQDAGEKISGGDFLGWLYRKCEPNDGYVNFRFFSHDKKIAWNRFLLLAEVVGGNGKMEQVLKEPGQKYPNKKMGSYFAVGLRKNKVGTKAGVTKIPAIYLDLDKSPLQPVLDSSPAPSGVVNTSPGRNHVYWVLKEPAGPKDADRVEKINRKLVHRYGGDPACAEAGRVLRVPGTLNSKYDLPFQIKVLFTNDHEYNLSDFDALPDAKPVEKIREGASEGQRNGSLAKLCGEWVNKGLPVEDTLIWARGWNLTCRPPLPDTEVERTVRSIYATDARNHPEAKAAEPVPDVPYPQEAVQGVARDFADLYSSYLESPWSFFVFAFLTCLGNLMAGKVSVAGQLRTDPRLFTALIGESSDARKSEALRQTIELFCHTFVETGDINEPLFSYCSGVGSAEGLANRLNSDSNVLLVYDELKSFISKCSVQNSVLLPCVASLFESNRYQNTVKDKNIVVSDGKLSVIGACTQETFETMWTPMFMDIGFMNRLWLVNGRGVRKFSFPPEIPETLKTPLKKKIWEIYNHYPNKKIELDEDGRGLFNEWYMAQNIKSVYGLRLDTYGRRLMLLFAVNEIRDSITKDVVRRVISLLDWQKDLRRRLDPINADNKMAEAEERIRRALSKGVLTKRQLAHMTHASRIGLKFFHDALRLLEYNEEIGYDKKRKVYFLLKPEEDFVTESVAEGSATT